MAHSVEGRFPFLDRNVAALADSLPRSYKLHVLDEKHVLKRVAADLVPREILDRKKQPYRAPDALAFAGSQEAWIEEVGSERALADAGVFDPPAARRLLQKCLGRGEAGQFSNADNMAVVGILSTQLVHHQLLRSSADLRGRVPLRTCVDNLSPSDASPASV